MMEKYKDFLFAPDELPVYVAAPKVIETKLLVVANKLLIFSIFCWEIVFSVPLGYIVYY